MYLLTLGFNPHRYHSEIFSVSPSQIYLTFWYTWHSDILATRCSCPFWAWRRTTAEIIMEENDTCRWRFRNVFILFLWRHHPSLDPTCQPTNRYCLSIKIWKTCIFSSSDIQSKVHCFRNNEFFCVGDQIFRIKTNKMLHFCLSVDNFESFDDHWALNFNFTLFPALQSHLTSVHPKWKVYSDITNDRVTTSRQYWSNAGYCKWYCEYNPSTWNNGTQIDLNRLLDLGLPTSEQQPAQGGKILSDILISCFTNCGLWCLFRAHWVDNNKIYYLADNTVNKITE